MAERSVKLDYIRVLACLMIVTCHYFLFSNLNSGIGRNLAGIGNVVFFLLSALLYGSRSYEDVCAPNNTGREDIAFIIGKVFKLGSVLWPFLIVLVGLCIIYDVNFSWLDVGLNFAFLGYLGKLPGNGHLWFLTVLFACYVEYVILRHIHVPKQWLSWGLLIGMIFIMLLLEWLGIPGNAFAILGVYGFVFLQAKWLMQISKSVRIWQAALGILFLIVLLWLDYNGLFEKSRILFFLLHDFGGLLFLIMCLRYMPDKNNKVISMLSSIGFEIYIVHHTLCAGPFVHVAQLTGSHMANYAILIISSLVLAYLLHLVAAKLNQGFSLLLKSRS